ncbi:YkgJ family cysteine cluster protein [Robbsia sp. KACC 23696]|uniref:YkgJ family cysteine cluster protein n=1 Tax=Robbsia sp. KACC 23696 TaxID=3149231 RepID=UPI00325B73FA
MNIDFHCTKCAKCCHDLRLPLTVPEAVAWLSRGDTVEVLCEIVPWPDGQDLDHPEVAAKLQRTFAAISGTLPVRIGVVLAARHVGACPNLLSNGECGIYAERPSVCRIYPAEANPFVMLHKPAKACPDEAWDASGPPLLRNGNVIDATLRRDIVVRRHSDVADVRAKERLCAVLGFAFGAVWNEGFVSHKVEGASLLAALASAVRDDAVAETAGIAWTFLSERAESVDALNAVGAHAIPSQARPDLPVAYLSFK